MYKDSVNLLAFLTGLVLVFAINTSSFAAPTDAATEATVHQMAEFIAVGVMVISFCLGAQFGHTR